MEHLRLLVQWYLTQNAFAELSALVLLVLLCSLVARFFKQPMILAYIVTGIIASPYLLNIIHDKHTLEMFAHLGIAILLFMVGLWLNPMLIKETGKASIVTGLGQIIFTSIIGFVITYFMWFDIITSAYIAIALTFSSTIVIVKILTDKGVVDELYGRIAIGMLIVQDIVAMLFLVVVSSMQGLWIDTSWLHFVGMLFIKVLLVGWWLYLFARFLLPRIARYFAHSQEFLLIFALGWCFLLGSIFYAVWFSMEIGALLAWLTLATLPYRFEIMSKMKPLRDFFIILFFVYLGSGLQFGHIGNYIIPILVLSAFVLIGNPFIVMLLMGIMGYTKKNGMMVWLTVAQISEFSFILIWLWISAGHINDPYILSMITLIWLITITGSSYFFAFSDQLYKWLAPYLSIFERKKLLEEHRAPTVCSEVIVFGNHRTGSSIVSMLQRNNKSFVVVDFDPKVIAQLEKDGIPCMYGDATDIESFEEIRFDCIKMAISTIQNYDVTMTLLHHIKSHNPDAVVIVHARTADEAVSLYEKWADYVLVPHVLWGHQTAMMIDEYGYDLDKYVRTKMDHLSLLQNLH